MGLQDLGSGQPQEPCLPAALGSLPPLKVTLPAPDLPRWGYERCLCKAVQPQRPPLPWARGGYERSSLPFLLLCFLSLTWLEIWPGSWWILEASMARCPRAQCWGRLPAGGDKLPRATSPLMVLGPAAAGTYTQKPLKWPCCSGLGTWGSSQKLWGPGGRTAGSVGGCEVGRQQGCLRGAAQGALEGLRGQDPGTGQFPGRRITQALELPLLCLRPVY